MTLMFENMILIHMKQYFMLSADFTCQREFNRKYYRACENPSNVLWPVAYQGALLNLRILLKSHHLSHPGFSFELQFFKIESLLQTRIVEIKRHGPSSNVYPKP